MEPVFSILTPTFNRSAGFLPQTIESVQHQVEHGFTHEHIIIDDASTDDTAAVVAHYAQQDPRIRYIRNAQNAGTAASLNAGFAASTGSLILPFDDDDLLPQRALQMHYDFMQQPDLDWSIGYAFNIDDQNRLLDMSDRIPFFTPDKEIFLQALLEGNSIPNGAVIIRREALEKVGGWDPKVKSQDWEMWVKLAWHRLPAGLNERYLAFYRVHTHQLTTEHSKDGTWERDGEYLNALYGPTPSKKISSG